MGSAISSLFVPLYSLPGLYNLSSPLANDSCYGTEDNRFPLAPTFGGVVQLLYLGMTYAVLLGLGAKVISDGSELLLLIPRWAPFIGSIVLPILGNVPDGMIVLFSGLGPQSTVQNQLSVGIGTLAGSTVMLLTIPLTLSTYAGRVDIVNDHAKYKGVKLSGKHRVLTETGVEPTQFDIRNTVASMFLSTIPYFIIQGEAFHTQGGSVGLITSSEKPFALAGLIICFCSLALYLLSVIASNQSNVVLIGKMDHARLKALEKGTMDFETVFFDSLYDPSLLRSARGSFHGSMLNIGSILDGGSVVGEKVRRFLCCCTGAPKGEETPVKTLRAKELERFQNLLKIFFNKYDLDRSGNIDDVELALLLGDLRLPNTSAHVTKLISIMDTNHDGVISFKEFVVGIREVMEALQSVDHQRGGATPMSSHPVPHLSNADLTVVPENSPAAPVQLTSHVRAPSENLYNTIMGPSGRSLKSNDSGGGSGRTHIDSVSSMDARQALAHLFERSKIQPVQENEANSHRSEDEDDEDEDEEIPDDLKALSPEEQQKRILRRSCVMMFCGTILVVLVSDPLVDVLSELGNLIGISPFYVAFVLAPFASNASELVASYAYAQKKTRKSITISYATCIGGCVINNTFVLGIFLCLVYFRGLDWTYSAETISILVAELLVGLMVLRPVQPTYMALLTASIYPFTLFLVAILEGVAGLN